MRTLWKYIKPFLNVIYIGLLAKGASALLELLIPYIMSMIIDDIVPTGNVQGIILWTAVMIVCALLAWGTNIFANRNASKVSRDIIEILRNDLFDKTLYLSAEKTDAYTIPSLETRLTTDTYNIHRMLGMMMRIGIRGPIIMVGGLCITFFMEPVLSLVLLATMPFIGVLVYYRATKGIPLFRRVQDAEDRMVGVVRENAQGIRVIKALSRVEYEKNRYEGVNSELRDMRIKATRRMAVINPAMNLFLNIGLTAVLIVGAYRVSSGISETGKIIAFMSYFTIISRSMMAISRIFMMYSMGAASAGRVESVLLSESEKDWKAAGVPDGDPAYSIAFDDVSFSYLKVKDNLEHISFRLKKGETLGIIGATGSGKTTIMSLLLRFYDADKGAVYVNGQDVRNIEPSELRKKFGIVMQNDFLFRDTLAENIRFGRDVDIDDMDRAVSTAQAEEFISGLDEGYEYMLTGKGANLSGGQKQRVLLSRAFAADPEFLCLDDSSSALDYATDAKLRKALSEAHPDSTLIIIAQRISSVMNCDQIIMLEEGRISAAGTHDELMQKSALYASIYESQMGGALFD